MSSVRALRDMGKGLVFITNNSSRTSEDVAAKLTRLGFESEPSEVVTSASVTAQLLASRGIRSAFVVGEHGLREALRNVGIEVLDGEPASADCVVVGWDRSVDYPKLRTASLLVQRGSSLIATNPDLAFPAPDGYWPGAGALLSVITSTTGATAEVVGKPHAPIFQAALEIAGGGKPLVVGDRLDTDIEGAARLGWASLVVLTGVTDLASLDASPVKPTFLGEDLRSLFEDRDSGAGVSNGA